MKALASLRFAVAALFRRTKVEQNLNEELRFHLQSRADDLERSGLPRAEAERRARLEFGAMESYREECRNAFGLRMLDEIRADLRYAMRMVRKSPGFSLVAIGSLALGIGLNTAIFSVIDAVLLRPLPAPEPGQLVRAFQAGFGYTSYRNYRDLEHSSKTLKSLAAFSWANPVALTTSTRPGELHSEQVWSAAVSGNYFDVLGVHAALGRTFLPEEDQVPGKAPVVVISELLWRNHFNAEPNVIGKTVKINGHPFQVIGVAPSNFPQPETLFMHQLWIPIVMASQAGLGDRLQERRQTWLWTIGRLAPGATLTQARAEAAVIAKQIEAADPKDARELEFTVYRETDARLRMIPGVREFGWVLQAVVALVLLIACANIANLQLARSLARTKEMGIRLAIGAGRGRIIRQLLTESLLLALAGGTLALAFANWGARILINLQPGGMPVPLSVDTGPDWPVLLFALTTSVATGLLFGLVSAVRSTRFDLNPLLKSAGAITQPGRRWFSARNLLVGGQVALSFVLLIGAGLFIQSLINAQHLDLGFQPEHRLLASVNPATHGYSDDQGKVYHLEALHRLAKLPGVISASSTAMLPLSGGYLGDGYIWPEGDTEPSDARRPMIFFDNVGPGYFQTMGATLLDGREFTERDAERSPQVAVVNENFARSFWPGQRALGKRFRAEGVNGSLIEIIGVVRDGKYHSLGETTQRHVFTPLLQGYVSFFTFILKTEGDPRSVSGAVRAELHALDPGLPADKLETMADHLGFAFYRARIGAGLLGIFALLGLSLSAMGLYGVLAFLVNRSIPEIGIRVAIGAHPGAVRGLFIRRGLALAASGLCVGIVAALLATRVLASFLYSVNPLDPAIFAAVAVLLLGVAFLASYVPSRRAANIEPMRALRHE
jgi:macrolide transport system ATP-binding/permease protein